MDFQKFLVNLNEVQMRFNICDIKNANKKSNKDLFKTFFFGKKMLSIFIVGRLNFGEKANNYIC